MIEQPTISHDEGTILILDHRFDRSGQRLRFWGGVLIGGALLLTFLVPSWRRFDDPIDLVIPLSTVVIGSILIMLAGRPTARQIPLGRVMPQDGLVRVYAAASRVMGGRDRDIWIDEVESVLFGMTRYPMDEARPEVKVEAFTLCLTLYDGSVVPLIEASPDKGASYAVALAVGESLGVPVIQAGLGV